MKMTRNQYIDRREFFRLKAVRAEQAGDIQESSYFCGIVRGLDLAFGDGTANPNLTLSPTSQKGE